MGAHIIVVESKERGRVWAGTCRGALRGAKRQRLDEFVLASSQQTFGIFEKKRLSRSKWLFPKAIGRT